MKPLGGDITLSTSIPVVCGDVLGELLLATGKIRCHGQDYSPTEFERMGGKSAAKKWKQSIRLGERDGDGNVLPNQPIPKVWLAQKGLKIETNTLNTVSGPFLNASPPPLPNQVSLMAVDPFLKHHLTQLPQFCQELMTISVQPPQPAYSEHRANPPAAKGLQNALLPGALSAAVHESQLQPRPWPSWLREEALSAMQDYLEGRSSPLSQPAFEAMKEIEQLRVHGSTLDLRKLYIAVRAAGGYQALQGAIWNDIAAECVQPRPDTGLVAGTDIHSKSSPTNTVATTISTVGYSSAPNPSSPAREEHGSSSCMFLARRVRFVYERFLLRMERKEQLMVQCGMGGIEVAYPSTVGMPMPLIGGATRSSMEAAHAGPQGHYSAAAALPAHTHSVQTDSMELELPLAASDPHQRNGTDQHPNLQHPLPQQFPYHPQHLQPLLLSRTLSGGIAKRKARRCVSSSSLNGSPGPMEEAATLSVWGGSSANIQRSSRSCSRSRSQGLRTHRASGPGSAAPSCDTRATEHVGSTGLVRKPKRSWGATCSVSEEDEAGTGPVLPHAPALFSCQSLLVDLQLQHEGHKHGQHHSQPFQQPGPHPLPHWSPQLQCPSQPFTSPQLLGLPQVGGTEVPSSSFSLPRCTLSLNTPTAKIDNQAMHVLISNSQLPIYPANQQQQLDAMDLMPIQLNVHGHSSHPGSGLPTPSPYELDAMADSFDKVFNGQLVDLEQVSLGDEVFGVLGGGDTLGWPEEAVGRLGCGARSEQQAGRQGSNDGGHHGGNTCMDVQMDVQQSDSGTPLRLDALGVPCLPQPQQQQQAGGCLAPLVSSHSAHHEAPPSSTSANSSNTEDAAALGADGTAKVRATSSTVPQQATPAMRPQHGHPKGHITDVRPSKTGGSMHPLANTGGAPGSIARLPNLHVHTPAWLLHDNNPGRTNSSGGVRCDVTFSEPLGVPHVPPSHLVRCDYPAPNPSPVHPELNSPAAAGPHPIN